MRLNDFPLDCRIILVKILNNTPIFYRIYKVIPNGWKYEYILT